MTSREVEPTEEPIEEAVARHLARRLSGVEVTVEAATHSRPGSGDPGAHPGPLTENDAERLGAAGAQITLALQGFFHADAGRVVDSDVRRLPAVVDAAVPALQRLLEVLPAVADLPGGVQHAAVGPDTVAVDVLTDVAVDVRADVRVDDEHRLSRVTGLDQAHHTAAVCDLAATASAVLAAAGPTSRPWSLLAALLRGYQRYRPLTLAEADVLGELVLGHLHLRDAPGRGRPARAPRAPDQLVGELQGMDQAALRHRIRRLAGLGAPGLADAARFGGPVGADLLSRRRAVQGGPLSPLFYAEPLDIVAAEGVWLHDRSGRRYLDGYNNVAVVGHSHPSVVQAISRQAARLHTHSRYLHPNAVELAERLVASMPPGSGLDTCLFTTSGTEANELAWRLATEYTGGDGAIIGAHAYHGASKQMADLSSNEWPPGYRPAGVATFEPPLRQEPAPTPAEALARIAAATDELALAGRRPAMVIADSMFTSDGVRTAPGGFMSALVDGAHAAGALYVADEVQVGFGRTGPQLWWFAALGMTPDVVTLGKPMGAGYPIGAVLTRRGIADVLAARYEYFSTFAANPVGTAASLAVLDLLEDGEIPAHAVRLGDVVRAGVATLRTAHPALGEVRGAGLIAGIDLPSRAAATAVSEGLKQRGVLVGTTGRGGRVLKVRPPLVWRRRHAERFLRALDATLVEVAAT